MTSADNAVLCTSTMVTASLFCPAKPFAGDCSCNHAATRAAADPPVVPSLCKRELVIARPYHAHSAIINV